MKKILLILILVLMAAPVYALTSAIHGVVSGSYVSGGGGSCSESPFLSLTTVDDYTGLSGVNGGGQGGMSFTSRNLCRVDVHVQTSPTSDSCRVLVYNSSNTLVCTSSDLAYTSMTNDAWNAFTFSTDCNLNGTDYYVVAQCDASWEVDDGSDSGHATTGNLRICDAPPTTGAYDYTDYDAAMRFYAK